MVGEGGGRDLAAEFRNSEVIKVTSVKYEVFESMRQSAIINDGRTLFLIINVKSNIIIMSLRTQRVRERKRPDEAP